ncbi:MAG: hypothetical protein JKX76_00875 [Colwellia sp.]|nr:hypothetical protein [Colwellia sp.]
MNLKYECWFGHYLQSAELIYHFTQLMNFAASHNLVNILEWGEYTTKNKTLDFNFCTTPDINILRRESIQEINSDGIRESGVQLSQYFLENNCRVWNSPKPLILPKFHTIKDEVPCTSSSFINKGGIFEHLVKISKKSYMSVKCQCCTYHWYHNLSPEMKSLF